MLDISKYPQYLDTYDDYEFVRKNFDRKYWVRDFQNLLTDAYVDVPLGEFTPVLENDTVVDVQRESLFDLEKEKDREVVKELYNLMRSSDCYETVTLEGFESSGDLRVYLYDDQKYYLVTKPVLNPNCKLLRLGYKVEEVMDIIFEEEEKEAHEKVNQMAEESLKRIQEESGLSKEEMDALIEETDQEIQAQESNK